MTEETGGKYGPREDEALKRELRGDLQANRATRAEDWRDPEAPGEDEPEATYVLEGHPGGTPPGEDWDIIELRSHLARHLDRTAFPATRERLIEVLQSHEAEDQLIDLVSGLPEGTTYASFRDVLEALGIPIEHRPA